MFFKNDPLKKVANVNVIDLSFSAIETFPVRNYYPNPLVRDYAESMDSKAGDWTFTASLARDGSHIRVTCYHPFFRGATVDVPVGDGDLKAATRLAITGPEKKAAAVPTPGQPVEWTPNKGIGAEFCPVEYRNRRAHAMVQYAPESPLFEGWSLPWAVRPSEFLRDHKVYTQFARI